MCDVCSPGNPFWNAAINLSLFGTAVLFIITFFLATLKKKMYAFGISVFLCLFCLFAEYMNDSILIQYLATSICSLITILALIFILIWYIIKKFSSKK
jgi:hypothetical protein